MPTAPPGWQSLATRLLTALLYRVYNAAMKQVKTYRPEIPGELRDAARIAGAPLGLDPRDYIVLALRNTLRVAGALPAEWEMTGEEIAALKELDS